MLEVEKVDVTQKIIRGLDAVAAILDLEFQVNPEFVPCAEVSSPVFCGAARRRLNPIHSKLEQPTGILTNELHLGVDLTETGPLKNFGRGLQRWQSS